MMRLAKFSAGAAALACALAVVSAAPVAVANGGGGGAQMSEPPSGGGQRQVDPAQAYQAGVTALQAQNYSEAIRHFRSARRAAPNDGVINYALGVAYVGAGEQRDARGAFERSVRADNAPAAAHLQLGLVYIELGERERAVEQQAALAGLVSACDAACGDARRTQLQAALNQLTLALEAPAPTGADPAVTGWNFPSVQEGRAAYAEAVGLINQERFPEAFVALTRAREAVGPHPDVLNYMGFVSRKLGRLEVALAYYGEALAIDPGHLGANEYLGELYLQMGDVAAARRQLAELDRLCAYGCAQREELARWIEAAGE